MAKDVIDKPEADVQTGEGMNELESIRLKRQVTVKTIVTEAFRQKAKAELSEELKLIDSQLEQLENQYQAMLKQIETLAKNGQNVGLQLEQLNREAQEKRTQLANVKVQVASNLANLDRMQNGDNVITGSLENYVDLAVGENIYDRLRGAEVIIEDGIVKTILG